MRSLRVRVLVIGVLAAFAVGCGTAPEADAHSTPLAADPAMSLHHLHGLMAHGDALNTSLDLLASMR